MNAIRLRTEYLKNPLGIDIKHPRLMWNCEGGTKQTAYQIVTENRDSGKVASSSMWAEYPKRVQYQSYDVTEQIVTGENELSVQLADGWYRGSCGANGIVNQYGTETRLLAQLEIVFRDGSVQTVVTDESWGWSNDGPIRFADNKDGETVEAFRTPLYNGKAKLTTHKVRPTCSNNVPVTEHETFKPSVITTPSGKTVLDFGQNIQGHVSFTLDAHVGQRVFLRFGEMLDKDGEFTQKNIQLSNRGKTTPLQQVDYSCGEGRNEYKTTFTPRARRWNGCSPPCAASGWTARIILRSPRDPADTSPMPARNTTASTAPWKANGKGKREKPSIPLPFPTTARRKSCSRAARKKPSARGSIR